MLIQDLVDFKLSAHTEWVDSDTVLLRITRVSTVMPYADLEFYFTVAELQAFSSVLDSVLQG